MGKLIREGREKGEDGCTNRERIGRGGFFQLIMAPNVPAIGFLGVGFQNSKLVILQKIYDLKIEIQCSSTT